MTQTDTNLSVAVLSSYKLNYQAASIAEQLSCTLCDNPDLHDLVLILHQISESNAFSLELLINGINPPLRLVLDFNSNQAQHRKTKGGGKRQHLIRATGLHKHALRILDATAGLGTDAYVLACNGANITLIEQHPILSALLENAISCALTLPIAEIASRMHIMGNVNSIEFLKSKQSSDFDVLYLDPMYPTSSKKTAKAKKAMQIIQYLLQDTVNQADQLLQAGLESSIKRIVVKRPSSAEHLLALKPQSIIESSNTRYDIYIP